MQGERLWLSVSILSPYTRRKRSDTRIYICQQCTEDCILESIQKRAFKIITGGIVRTPANYLYNEIGLETSKTRRDRNVLLFFSFLIMHNMIPDYLQELKPEKQKQGRYMFCNKNDLAEPHWRITKYQKSLLPFAVSLWKILVEKKELLQIMSFLKIL